MKILFNVMTLNKGGAERVINVLANEFAKKNDVKIVTNIKEKINYNFNKKIIINCLDKKERGKISKKISRLSFLKLIMLRSEIVDFKPDIIISFLPEPSIRLSLLKIFSSNVRKIPTIISERNNPEAEYNNIIIKSIVKFLYKKNEFFIFQTKEAARFFEGSASNYDIINNPVDDRFLKVDYCGIDSKRIINVGRLCNQKNQKMLINAFCKFHSNNLSYRLEIYGEGPLKKELKKIIDKKNAVDYIFLKGNDDNIHDVLKNAEMFILTSNYEGMPNALIEAMVVGVPCISTDCPCGGPKTLINDNNNGFLTKINNEEELIEKMEELALNYELRKKFSTNSKGIIKLVRKEFIVKKWYEIINKIVERR